MLARVLVIVLASACSAFAAAPKTAPSLDELRQQEKCELDRLARISEQLERLTVDEPPSTNPAAAQKEREERLTMLNNLKQRYQFRKAELSRDLREKAVRLSIDGMGKSGRLHAKEAELQELLKLASELKRAYDEATAKYDRAVRTLNEGMELPEVEEAMASDPKLHAMRDDLSAVTDKKMRDQLQRAYEDQVAELRAKRTAAIVEKLHQKKNEAAAALRAVQERVDAARADLGDLTKAMKQYLTLKDDEETHRELLKKVNEQLEQLLAQGPQPAPEAQWVERLEARKQQAQADLANLRTAIRAAEEEQFVAQFGDGPASLFLSRDALAGAKPSLQNVTYAGSAKIDGRRFLRFKNSTGDWLIDATTIAAVHRAPKGE